MSVFKPFPATRSQNKVLRGSKRLLRLACVRLAWEDVLSRMIYQFFVFKHLMAFVVVLKLQRVREKGFVLCWEQIMVVEMGLRWIFCVVRELRNIAGIGSGCGSHHQQLRHHVSNPKNITLKAYVPSIYA